MSLFLLAAVRREHRRLTRVCQTMDRRATPPGVVALLEDAMLTLDDAARLIEATTPEPVHGCPGCSTTRTTL